MTEEAAWVNPQWNGRDPGAFAVIIGVSRYDHLPGGDGEPARETYGLPQLHVCALTAHRFFRWLRDQYVADGRRLAKCWLLLAPTPEEVTARPEVGGWPRPTFDACARAVGQWFATMRDLPAEVARQSRSLFFFTGHGLELRHDDQVLLPSDYLEGPAPVVNRALSTRNLQSGLAGLGVPVQLFFIDACRNDHSRFRERGLRLTGTDVLNEEGSAYASPDVVAPIVYATTSGAQAFQPTSVAGELSLFGRALIEGLSEPPAQIRACDPRLCHVGLFDLVKFLGCRVPELLAQYGSLAAQPVTLGGRSRPVTVADVETTAKARPMPPDPATTGQRLLRVSAGLPSTDWGNLDGARTTDLDVFGGGPMAGLWTGHALRTAAGDAVRHELIAVARQGTGAYRLTVRIPDASVPATLRLSDGAAVLSCRLPALGTDAVVRLDADRNDSGGWNLSVGVDPSAPGIAGRAASCWLRYAEGDASAASREAGSLVGPVLTGESATPLPALIAALVRLRVDPQPALPWLRELALLYPGWPDFQILLAESELRSADRDLTGRAPAALTAYALAFTAEALGYAAAQAAVEARRPGARDPAASAVSQSVLEALDLLQPGGLFCVMSYPGRA